MSHHRHSSMSHHRHSTLHRSSSKSLEALGLETEKRKHQKREATERIDVEPISLDFHGKGSGWSNLVKKVFIVVFFIGVGWLVYQITFRPDRIHKAVDRFHSSTSSVVRSLSKKKKNNKGRTIENIGREISDEKRTGKLTDESTPRGMDKPTPRDQPSFTDPTVTHCPRIEEDAKRQPLVAVTSVMIRSDHRDNPKPLRRFSISKLHEPEMPRNPLSDGNHPSVPDDHQHLSSRKREIDELFKKNRKKSETKQRSLLQKLKDTTRTFVSA
jgi:hypothetical protein